MKTKHTQGKWSAFPNEEGDITIQSDNGTLIGCAWDEGQQEMKANAKLIAAAPNTINELIWEVEFLEGLLTDGLSMQTAHRSTINARINVLKETIKQAI